MTNTRDMCLDCLVAARTDLGMNWRLSVNASRASSPLGDPVSVASRWEEVWNARTITTNEHWIPENSRQNGRLRMLRVNISTNMSFSANTTPTICTGSTRTTIHCNQTHAQPSTRFCGRETSRGPRAALAAIKLSRCDSLRLVLMLCLPKPSASRGLRSTQNTKTSHAENHENTPVQCAHDKWMTNEN